MSNNCLIPFPRRIFPEAACCKSSIRELLLAIRKPPLQKIQKQTRRITMSERRVDAFKQAIKMEQDGKSFYEQSAGKVMSILAKRVFQDLAMAEDKHIAKLTKIYNSLKETGNWPDVVLNREASETIPNIFSNVLNTIDERIKANTTDIEALKMAAGLENDGIKFYQAKSEETGDFFQKKFFMLLAKEESEHFITLLDTIEYLEDPQGYFSQLEKGTMSF
jgi:rubrerythrin